MRNLFEKFPDAVAVLIVFGFPNLMAYLSGESLPFSFQHGMLMAIWLRLVKFDWGVEKKAAKL